MQQADIAIRLGIDPKTMRKYPRDELDRGAIEATARMEQSLSRIASEGSTVAAASFWLKVRTGWRTKHEVNLTGKPLQELSDTQRARLAHLREDVDDEVSGVADSAAARMF
jgi:hypothetical protein